MELIYNHDEKNWDAFVLQNSKSFLQSFAWGNFQQSNSGKVFRLCVQKNGQTLVQTQIVKESFSFKKYFYIPFGPIFKNGIESKRKSEALKFLLDSIKELAKEEDCVFLRIEPFEELGEINGYMVNKSLRRMQPRKTLIMDLQKSEEELLKEFKPKTRQNINFARKSGIEIKKNKQNFEDFYKLMQETKERREFGIHTRKYYENILKIGGGSMESELFLAKYQNKAINSLVAVFFGNRVTTLHAGSDYEYRHFKSANLLYWEVILEAKRKGMKELDFWGIDEFKWPGITIFKKGFSGIEFEYPQGIEIAYQKFWYFAYKIYRILKRK